MQLQISQDLFLSLTPTQAKKTRTHSSHKVITKATHIQN